MASTLTHRRNSNKLPHGFALLFAESGNEHYGDHCWTLLTELPEVTDEVAEFAAEHYGVDMDEARELVNPADIVDSAGAWDDHDFVSALWQRFEAQCREDEAIGWRTQDGAVVIDAGAIKTAYSCYGFAGV